MSKKKPATEDLDQASATVLDRLSAWWNREVGDLSPHMKAAEKVRNLEGQLERAREQLRIEAEKIKPKVEKLKALEKSLNTNGHALKIRPKKTPLGRELGKLDADHKKALKADQKKMLSRPPKQKQTWHQFAASVKAKSGGKLDLVRAPMDIERFFEKQWNAGAKPKDALKRFENQRSLKEVDVDELEEQGEKRLLASMGKAPKPKVPTVRAKKGEAAEVSEEEERALEGAAP
jgi:hypothetical protein